MATQAASGRRATLEVGTTSNLSGGVMSWEARNWRITPTQEMIDASSADSSGWNEFIPGQRGWVFTAEACYINDTDQRRLANQLAGASGKKIVKFKLRMFSNNGLLAAGQWLGGASGVASSTDRAAYLTNFRVGGRYDDLQLFEVEIRGDGVLTYSSA